MKQTKTIEVTSRLADRLAVVARNRGVSIAVLVEPVINAALDKEHDCSSDTTYPEWARIWEMNVVKKLEQGSNTP